MNRKDADLRYNSLLPAGRNIFRGQQFEANHQKALLLERGMLVVLACHSLDKKLLYSVMPHPKNSHRWVQLLH